MSNYCSHCGFANAQNAIRCENCKLFIGVSPQDKGITSFSGIRLVVILVVVGFLSLAIYTMLKSPPPPKPSQETKFFDKQRQEEEQKRQRERLNR